MSNSFIQLKKLEKNLIEQLTLLNQAIEQNTKDLSEYLKKHGDLYVRHELDDGSAKKTHILKNFLASEMRLEIKSLLESVLIIRSKLYQKGVGDGDGEVDTTNTEERSATHLLLHEKTETAGSIPKTIDMDSEAKLKRTRAKIRRIKGDGEIKEG